MGPSLLEEIVANSCLNEYFQPTSDYITAHTKVLGGPVLCPALSHLSISPHEGVLRLKQGVDVTDVRAQAIDARTRDKMCAFTTCVRTFVHRSS